MVITQAYAATDGDHLQGGAADRREIGVQPGDRHDQGVPQHRREPVLPRTAVAECLFEQRIERRQIEQRLVDVEDDNPLHGFLTRSRSRGLSVTVHVNGIAWGVKHTLSSQA